MHTVHIRLTLYFYILQEYLSQQDQIDQTGAYIKILKERIEELKRRKRHTDSTNLGESYKLPLLVIKELGADLEVGLITGLNKNFLLRQIISIIDEEGGEVVTVSISTIGEKIFHTIHAEVIAITKFFNARFSISIISRDIYALWGIHIYFWYYWVRRSLNSLIHKYSHP